MTLPSLLSHLWGLWPLCPLGLALVVVTRTDWGGVGHHHAPPSTRLITGLATVGLGEAVLAAPLVMSVVLPAVLPLHRLVLPCIPLNRDRVNLTSYGTRHITLPFISFTW